MFDRTLSFKNKLTSVLVGQCFQKQRPLNFRTKRTLSFKNKKTLKIETVCSGGGGGVGEARVLSPVNLAGENMNETDVPEVIPYLTLCKDKEVCGL